MYCFSTRNGDQVYFFSDKGSDFVEMILGWLGFRVKALGLEFGGVSGEHVRYTEIMRCAMVFEPFVAAWNIVVAPEVWIRKAQKHRVLKKEALKA